MSLSRFTASNFRCLAQVTLGLSRTKNLIVGPNASGKTSILEAIAYLGRGKSFRGAPVSALIRHGETSFELFGEASHEANRYAIGVRNGAKGLEVRVNGSDGGGAADLAEALPLLIADPEVHELVAGGPDGRRRYLDWVGFHVEHGYLASWRRFRRSLKQRNAALRAACGQDVLEGWNKEFVASALVLDEKRARTLERTVPALDSIGGALMKNTVGFEYRRGWPDGDALLEALRQGVERDRRHQNTYYGPHRADIKLAYDERQARKLVSRGQQKLLACTMVLAAARTVKDSLGKGLLLLLDDPAAELDSESLSLLLEEVRALDCQVVATSLTDNPELLGPDTAVFHVEHGEVRSSL